MSSLLELPTNKPSSSDQWVVTELYYPTSYGCHQGKQWSEDEFIRYSQFEIVDGPFSDKQEAIQAAISQRNNNDWFGEESESEKDETFGKLPPFNSAQLGNLRFLWGAKPVFYRSDGHNKIWISRNPLIGF